jgi:hypothetical protein
MKPTKGNHGKPERAKPGTPKNPETSKSQHLEVTAAPDKSRDSMMADVMTDGIAANASTATLFAQSTFGELSLTEMVRSLKEHGAAVNRGDFGSAERMLMAQANTLNVMFAELSRRGALNMGEFMSATETYLRLALKAQGQCRATLETLAAIKNPPLVFAKQANIAHGHQQVNNGQAPPTSTRAGAHAGETDSEQTELLEEKQHGGTVLDAGTAGATAGGNQAVEAVGAFNRAALRRRKGESKP